MIRIFTSATLILAILLLPTAASSQSLASIDPDNSCPNANFPMTITGSGTNWVAGGYSYINLTFSGSGVVGITPTIISTTTLISWVTVSNLAAPGPYTPTVEYFDGAATSIVSLIDGFEVNAGEIIDVNPAKNVQNTLFPITITGTCTDWQATPYSYINLIFSGAGLTVSNEAITSITTMDADVDISSTAAIGFRDVAVHYWDGTVGVIQIDEMIDGFEVLAANDAGVQSILAPVGGIPLNTVMTIEVDIHNYGYAPLNTVNVHYQVDTEPMVMESWTGALAPGNSESYTFTTRWTSPAEPGFINICSWTTEPNGGTDQVLSNDQSCETNVNVSVNGLASINPYISLYPNPYSDNLSIEYTLGARSHVLMEAYDLTGKLVATFIDEARNAGKHQYQLSADGLGLPVGVFLVRIEIDGQSYSRRLVHLK